MSIEFHDVGGVPHIEGQGSQTPWRQLIPVTSGGLALVGPGQAHFLEFVDDSESYELDEQQAKLTVHRGGTDLTFDLRHYAVWRVSVKDGVVTSTPVRP